MVDARLADAKSTFSSFSHLLDSRILRALADMGFARPTLVQTKAIPIALENRDILARARTGSGKTAAYCIPVLQKILSTKAVSPLCACSRPLRLIETGSTQTLSTVDSSYRVTRALILVPTRELSEQVHSCLRSLVAYCDKEVAISNVASGATSHIQRCGQTRCELGMFSHIPVAPYWQTSLTLSLQLHHGYWDSFNPKYVGRPPSRFTSHLSTDTRIVFPRVSSYR